jgi:hypothetical protein
MGVTSAATLAPASDTSAPLQALGSSCNGASPSPSERRRSFFGPVTRFTGPNRVDRLQIANKTGATYFRIRRLFTCKRLLFDTKDSTSENRGVPGSTRSRHHLKVLKTGGLSHCPPGTKAALLSSQMAESASIGFGAAASGTAGETSQTSTRSERVYASLNPDPDARGPSRSRVAAGRRAPDALSRVLGHACAAVLGRARSPASAGQRDLGDRYSGARLPLTQLF